MFFYGDAGAFVADGQFNYIILRNGTNGNAGFRWRIFGGVAYEID
jgi:hypothetical protein